MARLPMAWAQGRFLGEEGAVFFAFAWHRDAGEALWRSFGGYLNLGANSSTLFAARLVQWDIVPLELAPYVTMTIALLFQIIPALLLLYGRAAWLAKPWAVLAALAVLAISPLTEEVFFNVLHIQFHLALAAAIILTLDIPESRSCRNAYWLVLFIAPLCGPTAIILLPFFAMRGLFERDRARLVQATVLAAGTAIQLLAFFAPSPVRGNLLDPDTIAGLLFGRMVVLPLSNTMVAGALTDQIYFLWVEASIVRWLVVIAFVAYFGTLLRWAYRTPKSAAIWLILPSLTIGAISFGGGMIVNNSYDLFSVGAGERYNFLPLVLLGFGIIALAVHMEGVPRRICRYLCVLMLASGVISYWFPLPELSRGPAWRDEVAMWHGNHNMLLKAWPKTWKVDLSDADRPCSAPRPGGQPSGDPPFCESAWLERVSKPPPMNAQ